ncbi:MAG: sugar phosphate isomerase/epimerase [Planctomyces sp.]|nr:sugar phosphate isomerase/epimerase [Planctomyces sp.]
MESIRIAAATQGLALSLHDAIALASVAGAEGVQLDLRSEVSPDEFGESACRHLLHLLGERGMRVASATFPLRRALHDAVQIDGRVAAVKEGMRLASQLKSRVLTLRIGRLPANDDRAGRDRLQDALEDLARLGSKIGVAVALTTAGDDPDALLELLKGVQEGPIGVDLDPASCIAAGQDPSQVLNVLHAATIHVQARDAVRDVESGGLEVALGRGETRWDELLAMLGDARFAGWLTVRRTTGHDRGGDLVRAVAYLRQTALG